MLIDELATYLQSKGLGTIGTDIFEGRLMDTPDAQIALIDYAGRPSELTHDIAGIAYERPRVQVLARSSPDDYAGARTKANGAYKVLEFANQTLSGVRYLQVTALHPPFLLDRDHQERCVFAFNIDVLKELS